MSSEKVKKTLDVTTQMGRMPAGENFYRMYKATNPALNVRRRNEDLATDTVFASVPAVDTGGIQIAQLYFGCNTHVTDVYGMKLEKQFINTLEDIIRERGAPNRLISDSAQVEVSQRARDILRILQIGDWQSEPHRQNQNPAERRYQTVKRACNRVLNYSGAPEECWLLLVNHKYHRPIQLAYPPCTSSM